MRKISRGRVLVAASLLTLIVVPVSMLHRLRSAVSQRIARPTPHNVNLEAQELYLKGEYYLQKRTPESLGQAVEYYNQAIAKDPTYAQAYAGLADSYDLLREYTPMPASEAYPLALAAAKKAIALDDSLSGAHSALAFVDFYWLFDASGAEREFKRAIELDPNSVSARHWYATFLFHLGRFPEALAEIGHAQMLDPSSKSILADKGLILYHCGRQEEAIALLKQLEAAEPAFLSPRSYLAGMYLNSGNFQGYLEESEEAARLVRDQDRLSIVEAGERGFKEGGEKGMLQAMLARQTRLFAAGRVSAYTLAQTSARLGRQREALDYLRIACSRREPEVTGLIVDPGFHALHNHPEYRRLLAQVGLPPLQN